MKNSEQSSQARPLISQSRNNTTLWIGHLYTDPKDHFAGQTFRCPSSGILDNIQVLTSTVQKPGNVDLTLHEFDPESRTWGPTIGHSTLRVEKADDAKWIQFVLQAIPLQKGLTYGFRLNTNNAMIGLGEAATGNAQPFTFGHEWNGDSANQQGIFYSYFSLAFKIELRA